MTLHCSLYDPENRESTLQNISLRQDETKKAAFWIHDSTQIQTTTATTITTTTSSFVELFLAMDDASVFFFGGFQLFSNSKMMEIYLKESKEDEQKQDVYLTTARGLPATSEGEGVFKALLAVPGGARPVLSVRIKLMSLQPNGCTTFSLHKGKLTARVPETSTITSTEASTPPTDRSLPLPQTCDPSLHTRAPTITSPLSHQDISSAMAGMSFLVHTTEQRILERCQATEDALAQKIQDLTRTIQAQQVLIQSQHDMMMQQGQMLRQLCMTGIPPTETVETDRNDVAESISSTE